MASWVASSRGGRKYPLPAMRNIHYMRSVRRSAAGGGQLSARANRVDRESGTGERRVTRPRPTRLTRSGTWQGRQAPAPPPERPVGMAASRTRRRRRRRRSATRLASRCARRPARRGTAFASRSTQRSTQAGEQVHQHASDLRDVAQQLREQGKDGPAQVADQVAERAERAGSWMKDSDADRILADVEDFARSNPWAVAAGGLALGFVASRLLKASSSRRYEQRDAAPSCRRQAAHRRPAAARRMADGRTRPAVATSPARCRPSRPRRWPRARRRAARGATTPASRRAEAVCERAGRRPARAADRRAVQASSPTETSTLIRQEMELARAELTEKGKEAGKGAGLFGGAGAVGCSAPARITAGIVLLLDLAIAAWLAAHHRRPRLRRRRRRPRPQGPRPHPGGDAARPRTDRRNREGGRGMGEDPRAIRTEIEETRERMGDTVDALAYKADVKSRAKDSVNEKVDSLKSKVTGAKDSVADATPSGGDVKHQAQARRSASPRRTRSGSPSAPPRSASSPAC